MKLRNKKTGEIVEPFGITCVNGRTFIQFDDGKETFKFEAHSLTELCEEWEDYEEPESKYLYVIDPTRIKFISEVYKEDEPDWCEQALELGIGFENEEEAEQAVKKLKAWKRLKDKGFHFECVEEYENLCGNGFEIPIRAIMLPENYNDKEVANDLELLFGGEE